MFIPPHLVYLLWNYPELLEEYYPQLHTRVASPAQRFLATVSVLAAWIIAGLLALVIVSFLIGHGLLLKSSIQRDLESRGFDYVSKIDNFPGYQLWSVGVKKCTFTVKYDELTGRYSTKRLATGAETHTITPENLKRSGGTYVEYRKRCLVNR